MARIAMVVSNRHDPDVRVQKEAAALTRAGHQVTIYAFDREHDASRLPETVDGVRIERIQVREAPIGNLPLTMMGLVEFRAEVRKRLIANPVQVVHCHDQDTCAVGLWWKQEGASKSGLRSRGYFVFDAHDLYWTWLLMPDPDSRLRRLGARVIRHLDAHYARAADLLITTSEGIGPHPGFAEIYRSVGVDPVVVWNAPQRVENPPLLPDKFVVGYLGSVREVPMFQRLLEAISKLPPNRRPDLKIAGGGRCRREVEDLLSEGASKLGFKLEITGAFNFAELGRLMAGTSVQYCVYPTERGNVDRAMAVKLLDSVAYGRPVIGNAGSLMGDWIEANDWGWTVDEADTDALATAIDLARKRVMNAGKRMVLAPPPDWGDEADKLVRAYSSRLLL